MIAGQLHGGLTRTNLMLAQRAMDMTNPMFTLPGVKFNMNGNKDAYLLEGSDLVHVRLGAAGVGRAGQHHRAVGQDVELRVEHDDQRLQLTTSACLLLLGDSVRLN